MGECVMWWEKPKKRWTRRKIAAFTLIIILAGIAIYWFIVSPIIYYENLVLYNYYPYTWVANTKGQVTLVELSFENDGTKALSINKIFVNGTAVSVSDIAYDGGNTAPPNLGVNMLVFPQDLVFQQGANYIFLVQTASGRHFTFILPVDEAHTVPENLTILKWGFFYYPPDSQQGYIGVTIQESPLFNLITKAWVNNTEATLNTQWIWDGL